MSKTSDIQETRRELEWNDLAVILAIGRAGSLSGAARSLGKTVSGHRPGSSRRKGHPAISTSPFRFRRFRSGSLALASLDHTGRTSVRTLAATLTTTAYMSAGVSRRLLF